MSLPTLNHVFTMAITPKPPVNTGATPRGKANWFEITGGKITADGEHIADVLSGGGDYLTRYVEDNVAEVDMRLVARDSAGDLLRFTVSGYDYLDRATMLALDGRAGEEEEEEDVGGGGSSSSSSSRSGVAEPFGFEVLKCTTGSERFRWLNFAVLLARVKFVVGDAGIESVVYTVYEVTN
ncbi:uncharacterized protein TRIREDRAFT_105515 [Trichoderma reesei QM6a]|jgi:hypothetical protein|uniref:Predicted protein n=2 Tax=Hypocrea jecorina TaxID=51453 RepID=G0REV9_HYPJQ|nr:uncharacterized protein TRIREDRAFT_105515 [Trichoderma reesei QM6a]EGR50192.1 predicted protein [Trichoderma reesei QM6a]ETS03883.1 hypothetical protein M419DRAFT_74243 [Trichoderma reesei RUT C-30]